MTTFMSQRLAGKSLIGFDSSAPRMPVAMVGNVGETKLPVSQKLVGKSLIGFDSRAPRSPDAMVGGIGEGRVPRAPQAMVGVTAEVKPVS